MFWRLMFCVVIGFFALVAACTGRDRPSHADAAQDGGVANDTATDLE